MENKMRVLLVDNKSIGAPNILNAMRELQWELKVLQEDIDGRRRIPELEEKLTQCFKEAEYDFLFSFNFHPVLAEVCHQNGVRYVSWVYDSPQVALYSYTMVYDTNYVFLFDYEQFRELRDIGLTRVYYMPLASNTLSQVTGGEKKVFPHMPISFVGSLYNEEKNDLYKKLDGVSEYTKGYLDALIDAQRKIYGAYILQEGLTSEILKECQRVCPYNEKNNKGVETAAFIYADYFMARKVTALERVEALSRLSEEHDVYLFSYYKQEQLKRVHQMGSVNYYFDMPEVFRKSDINLNMTLKSIKTGIPVRVLDIMGAGGFVLTNYQVEMEEYFKAGVHYDYYASLEELEEKASFYLKNEAVRKKIALEGYKKTAEEFNYTTKIQQICEIVMKN